MMATKKSSSYNRVWWASSCKHHKGDWDGNNCEILVWARARTSTAPVNSLPELEKEALIIFLRDFEDLGHELLAIFQAELCGIHLLRQDVPILFHALEDGPPNAVISWQLLQGRPFQRLLIVCLPLLRRAAREHIIFRPSQSRIQTRRPSRIPHPWYIITHLHLLEASAEVYCEGPFSSSSHASATPGSQA